MRGACDSLFELIQMIEQNGCRVREPSIYDLFEIKFANERANFFDVSATSKNIFTSLNGYIKKYGKATFSNIIFFEIFRHLKNPHKERVDFPLKLDLGQYTDSENKKFNLSIIAAYATSHFCIFKKCSDSWYMIDDQFCYKVEEEMIQYLKGGKIKEPNPIWKTFNRKWVASILIYTADNYYIQ